MASTLNADNGVVSGSAGLKSSADSSGVLALQTNGTTAVTIDNAQNVGVGVTPSAWGNSYKAIEILNEGNVYASSNQLGATLNAYNNNTNWIYKTTDFASRYSQYQGGHYWSTAPSGTAGNTISWTTAMTLDASGNLDMTGSGSVGRTAGGSGIYFGTNAVLPSTGSALSDNTKSMGNASWRWSVIYAGTGTINTSDAREKTAVRPLTDSEITAAKQLANEIGAYRFLSAVEQKGDAAREHIGMTVQRAIEIMEANGLVPFNYGFICLDEWEAEIAEDGSVLKEAGSRYGFRMDELAMFVARGQQAIITTLTQRVEALEGAK